MLRIFHFAIAVALVACGGVEYFVCNGDEDCRAGSGDGVCQPTGSCSFPDASCASGQRYGDESPPSLASECVQHGGTTTGPDPQTTTSGGEGSGETVAADGRAASSSGDSADHGTSDGAMTTGTACPEDWWDCAYATRHRLTVARAVAPAMTNVPLLVVLDADRVDYAAMQNDGEDIRFVAAGGSALPFEIVQWQSGAESLAWVTVDTLGGDDDHLWLYYGNPVAQSPRGLGPTWAAPFVGVWGFDGATSDATANANDAATNGVVGFEPGQVGMAQDFVSADSRADVAPSRSITDVFANGGTASAWIYVRSWGGGDFGRITDKWTNDTGWRWYLGANGRLRFSVGWGPMMSRTWTTPTEVVPLDAWTHVAVTYDVSADTPARMYVNGVEAEQDPPPTPPSEPLQTDADRALTIGNRPDGGRHFDGLIDELRIATTVRSAEWLALQYASGTDVVIDYGAAEAQ